MKSPWSSLEEVPTLAAVAAEWRGHMGDAFEAFCAGKLLEKAGRTASSFPCPHKFGCTHQVKPRGNGFVGKSKDDDGVGCDDIPLTAEDVEVWELNRSRLGRAIAWALESEPKELRLLVPRTIQVASFGDGAVSVLLTLPQDRDEFLQVITALVAESGQPFVLVGPTNRFVDRRCRELLEKRNAEFLDLASCFEIQADGSLKTRRPAKELLARFVPAVRGRGAEAVTAAGGGAAPECLIMQEGTRRRAGIHDRTLVSTWRIRFRGHEVLMPSWVGTEYLIFLLGRQGAEFDASVLTQAIRKHGAVAGGAASKVAAREILHGAEGYGEDGEPVGGRVGDLNERDVIWDAGQIADCQRKIRRLEGEVRLHEKGNDFSSDAYLEVKRALEGQQELLAANAKKVSGKWVPKEYQKGTFQEKADVIRKHVRKVLDGHLRDNCRPLFDHLNDRDTLVYGVKNCYRPKPRVEWVIQLKGGKTGM